jgi:uncharacterized protein
MSKRKILLIVFVVLVGISIGFVALNIEIFNRLTLIDAKCARRVGEQQFTPDNFTDLEERIDTTPYLMESYETVSFPSRDNVTISGFFIPASVSSVSQTETVIIVHGFNDCKRRPFSLLPAGMLHRNDINALVIDLHNHGDSEVTIGRMTAGVDESLDALGAWDWLVDEKGIPSEKIGIVGYSLGAATTIHAMSAEPQLVAGWSDSAFDKMESVLIHELKREGFPTFLSSPALLTGRLVFGVDIMSVTPELAIQNVNNRPLYIVHSADDDAVPSASAETLIQVSNREQSDSLVWILDGPGHIKTMLDYPEEYEERLIGFFRQYLN